MTRLTLAYFIFGISGIGLDDPQKSKNKQEKVIFCLFLQKVVILL
jgi:hypothetical protein